jgi:membrane associated rhomboid family serine protease/Zn-finger nucleic acid-binding protein
MLALPVLQRVVGDETVRWLVSALRAETSELGLLCPSCGRAMRARSVPLDPEDSGGAAVVLDACLACRALWFDGDELHALPARVGATSSEEVPPSSQVEVALKEFRAEQDRRGFTRSSDFHPTAAWHWLVGVLGLPVEHRSDPSTRRPWLTWSVVLAIGLVGCLQLLIDGVWRGAFVPGAGWTSCWTLVTYFFLHGSLMHLVGNAYFLWIFGDNVEDYLGHAHAAALLLLATVAGGLLHGLVDPEHGLIGASGGISGVVVFYALRFPHFRLGPFFWWLVLFRGRAWFTISARTGLLCWLAFQALGIAIGAGEVSYAGHVGGAAVGLAFWFLDEARLRAGARKGLATARASRAEPAPR